MVSGDSKYLKFIHQHIVRYPARAGGDRAGEAYEALGPVTDPLHPFRDRS